jgi:uncharacterized membrane protein YebE (DUF533 family)
MGLLMRRRRPLMRMAGAATLGTVAYQSGKRHQAEVNDESQQAYAATQGPPPAAEAETSAALVAMVAPPNTTDELERLAKLHQESALTDAEFSAAKAKLLGI